MRKNLAIVAAFACLVAPGTVFAVEGGKPKAGPPAVGYACVSNPKTAETKVVMTPPPAGFKCPHGQTLFIVTKQMQDQVAAAPATELPVAGPAGAPDLSSPPGANPQEVRAPKKKKTQRKQCAPVDGGMYCCYNGGYSDCRLE